MTATVHSIQGERQKRREQRQREAVQAASLGDVDNYVDKKSQGILNCRTAGHIYPPLSKSEIVFTGWDFEADAAERAVTCVNGCGCIDRVELWQRRGGRWNKIGTKRREHANADGETYAMPPGQGRASRKDICESVVSLALQGVTPTQIKKQLGIK